MSAKRPETIPAFLSFDVEPDGFQLARGAASVWPGYAACFELSREIRRALARASGADPSFGWYFRTDPQVAEACGRADDALARFPDRVAELREAGDHFGVHAHLIRWDPDRGLWVHDVTDGVWVRECVAFALDAFEASTGSRARLYRAGAGYLSDGILDVLEEHGVRMELSLEPGPSWALTRSSVTVAADSSPIVGRYVDAQDAPRTPYRPDPRDFRRRGGAEARGIVLVPMTAGPRRVPPGAWGVRLRRLVGWPCEPKTSHVLYPSNHGSSPRRFWDVVEHQVSTMERPYVSLGVRTDDPRSVQVRRVIRVLSALSGHPLAKRLRFVSPLDALERILPREPARETVPS